MKMRLFLVIVTERADWSEAVEGVAWTQTEAVQVGQKLLEALPQKLVRCRIKAVNWTAKQLQDLWRDWGRRDAEQGWPLSGKIAAEYARAYRRGYRAGLAARRAKRIGRRE